MLGYYGEHKIVCKNTMFTAHSLRSFKTPSTQRMLCFSFIPKAFGLNETHPKLRFICFIAQNDTILNEAIIRWIPRGILKYPARRAWVYFFSPSQRKEIKRTLSASSASQAKPRRGGTSGRLIFKDFNRVLAWTHMQSILCYY